MWGEGVDPRFAAYLFQSEAVGSAAERTAIGTKMPRTSWTLLRNERVFLPTLAEQRVASKILDNLDAHIQRTEALIAKLEQIKQGLLADLLTRGIDENGQLRPSPEKAPHLYAASPLGHIPNEWGFDRIKNVCEMGRGRVISQEYVNKHPGPYPVYSSQTKHEGVFGRINTFDFEGPHVTWTTDGANAGKVLYREGRFNCTNVCGTLRASQDNLSLTFVAFGLDRLTDRYVSRVGNDKLMNNVVAQMFIQLPPIEEQRCIARSLNPINNRIVKEKTVLQELRAVKEGLMDDLLTGGVRVNPLLNQTEQATG